MKRLDFIKKTAIIPLIGIFKVKKLSLEEYLIQKEYMEKAGSHLYWGRFGEVKSPTRNTLRYVSYKKNNVDIIINHKGVLITKVYKIYNPETEYQTTSSSVLYSGLIPTIEEFKILEKLLEL
jgi:hypothetical protein